MNKAFVRPHRRRSPKTKQPIPVVGYANNKPSLAFRQAPAMDSREWIGVDLDRTLAHYESGQDLSTIGHPIPAMLTRVRRWLREGKRVKIMTARAQDVQQIPIIQAWLV